jgi:hypothetical protein
LGDLAAVAAAVASIVLAFITWLYLDSTRQLVDETKLTRTRDELWRQGEVGREATQRVLAALQAFPASGRSATAEDADGLDKCLSRDLALLPDEEVKARVMVARLTAFTVAISPEAQLPDGRGVALRKVQSAVGAASVAVQQYLRGEPLTPWLSDLPPRQAAQAWIWSSGWAWEESNTGSAYRTSTLSSAGPQTSGNEQEPTGTDGK